MRNIKTGMIPFAILAILMMLMTMVCFSCVPAGQNIVSHYPDMPPLSKIMKVDSTFTPKSQRYKIAVLTFIDQTEKAGLVTDPIADILTTELFKNNRFDLYDRSDLTQKTITITDTHHEKEVEPDGEISSEKKTRKVETRGDSSDLTSMQYRNVEKLVDGILIGYITSYEAGKKEGKFEFDYRIVNASAPKNMAQVKKLIGFSGTGTVNFVTDPEHQSVTFNREDVKVIAETIRKGFAGKYKELSDSNEIRIVDQEGYKITINAGSNQNIGQGFAGYVVKETRLGTFEYLAEFVIVNTFPDASIGFIVSDERTWGSVSKQAIVKIK